MIKEPIQIGSAKQLFIDEKFIEKKTGIALNLHPPVKAEPLVLAGQRVGVYSSLVEYAGKYYLYYSITGGYAVATSEDGIHWQNPDLGKPEPQRSLVFPRCTEGGVFIDPKPADGYPFKAIFGLEEPDLWRSNLVNADEVSLLKAVYGFPVVAGEPLEGALYLFRSRNGLNWEVIPKVAVPFVCDSGNQVFYDWRLGRYVAYLRGLSEGGGYPYNGRIVVRTEITDLMQMPWPFRKNEIRAVGPRGCYGYIHPDEMDVVLANDEDDPSRTDVYNPAVNLYPYGQDVYLAFPSMFRAYGEGLVDRKDRPKNYGRDFRGEEASDGFFEVQLAVSRDGKNFTRFHTPYIGPGLAQDRYGLIGEPDCGLVLMGIGMLRQNDYLYQYYCGTHRTHVGHDVAEKRGIDVDTDSKMLRVVQRLDGFVSADAGVAGGKFVTPVLTFAGNRLVLNADCSGLGEIWVELQDGDGEPIAGYSFDDALSIERNGTSQEIWWKNGPDLSNLAGKPIRMHIKMRSAKLYAFQFLKNNAK